MENADLQVALMWRLSERLSSNMTPRSLAHEDGHMLPLPIMMDRGRGWFWCLDWRQRNSAFPSFNFRPFQGMHCWILVMHASSQLGDSCRASGEVRQLYDRNSSVSSAYKWYPVSWEHIMSPTGNVHIVNKMDPSTKPCGTPQPRGLLVNHWPEIITHCEQSVK